MENIDTLILKCQQQKISGAVKNRLKELTWRFVICSPCKGTSTTGKKFNDLKLVTSCEYTKHLDFVKQTLKVDESNYHYCKSSKMNEKIPDLLGTKNTLIFFAPNNIGQTDALYSKIRNSFAHGNFINFKGGSENRILLWNFNGKSIQSYMNISLASLEKLSKFIQFNLET